MFKRSISYMVLRLCYFIFFSVLFFGGMSQVDTSFWFVAPDVSATLGDNPINLHVQTYNQAATVFVRQPANPGGVNATLTIPANTNTVLNLTASITAVESAPVNAVANKGIYISSNNFVSVLYSIAAASSKEMISLKGRRAVGVDYYLPVPNNLLTASSYTDGGISCDVVATGTGVTTLLITPRAACVGHAANVTFSVSLNQGQTYSLRDNNAANPSQLGGSIVSSDKPIAVTLSGIVQNNPGSASYYADQITSSSVIGKDYVILKGNGGSDYAYVMSTVNNTSLTITTGTSVVNTVINFGETYSVNVNSGISYVKSTQPVYVLHASGFGYRMSGAQVPPAYCAGSYTSSFTRLSADSFFLNIFTRSGFQNTFTLTSNGTTLSVPAGNFTTVPGSGGALVAARIYFSAVNIAPGSYNVLSNSQDIFGLGVINGSTPNGSSYAFVSDFASQPFVIPNATPSATICSNTTFTLNGVAGGGPLTGIWSSNGYGSLSGPPSQLLNNVYTPSQIDTSIKPLTFTLTSTGICPNVSSTFSLWVNQAPIVNAGTDQIICSNNPTVQLGGNILGFTNQGVWSMVTPASGSFAPTNTVLNAQYFASAADTSLNSLKLVLTSTNNAGCNAVRDTMTVYMNKAPIVTASTINPIVRCSNNPNVFLNGYIGGTVTSTGQWTTSGTGFFSPNNLSLISNYIPSPADIATGSVTLKLTSTNNQQCKQVSDSVVVLFTQPATITVGPDLNGCKNNPQVVLTASITGTVTGTGVWYGGNGIFNPTNTALTTTYVATPAEVAAGYVILTFSTTNNGLCNGVNDQLRIDFQDKPLANFTVNTVCLNQITLFADISVPNGTVPITGWQWNLGDGTTTNVINPSHTYTNAGAYSAQLVITNATGCHDTISRPVNVYALPNTSMSISRACTGSSLQISFTDLSTITPPATIPNPGGYYWDFGGVGFSYAKDTTIIFPSQGVYYVSHEVTSSSGCKSTVSQSVNITPVPFAKFYYVNNTSQSGETTIAFTDSSRSATTWNWDFGNGLTSVLQNPSTTYTANGDYTITLTINDQFGCPSTYSATIKVENIAFEIDNLIPNIISPNGDSKNDVWRLDFIDVYYKDAEIDIFNRWGDKIFHSIGYANAWDGTYKGAALPVGVYFYTLKLNDGKDNKIYKGTITLIK